MIEIVIATCPPSSSADQWPCDLRCTSVHITQFVICARPRLPENMREHPRRNASVIDLPPGSSKENFGGLSFQPLVLKRPVFLTRGLLLRPYNARFWIVSRKAASNELKQCRTHSTVGSGRR